tara:strand:+ start:370 stop:510 length:141 start_codon:yes stop_codon:yes gene_type:complete
MVIKVLVPLRDKRKIHEKPSFSLHHSTEERRYLSYQRKISMGRWAY